MYPEPMIAGTYIGSGLLLFGTAWLFHSGQLTANTLTACWCVVLFFASTGASSAYLTVSEIFPTETRAMAIAFFSAQLFLAPSFDEVLQFLLPESADSARSSLSALRC